MSVESVVRVAQILRSLSNGTDRISKIADEIHLSNSTVHRLLQTMEDVGLAGRDPTNRRYFLGPFISSLAFKLRAPHQRLISMATKPLEQLRNETGETVGLIMRTGVQRTHLMEILSLQELRYTALKDSPVPVYAGAAGKVLLSQLGMDEAKDLIRRMEPVLLGPNTIIDKDAILREVTKTRQVGYAISAGEITEGVMSVSVPVYNYVFPLALCVYGPEFRLTDKVMEIVGLLKKTTARIAQDLSELGT